MVGCSVGVAGFPGFFVGVGSGVGVLVGFGVGVNGVLSGESGFGSYTSCRFSSIPRTSLR
jgi:hypothetical protein